MKGVSVKGYKDPSPQATEAGGMHPTRMHSCSVLKLITTIFCPFVS